MDTSVILQSVNMHADENLFDETLLDKVMRLQSGLIAQATDGSFAGGDEAYRELRLELASRADIKSKIPDFVRQASNLAQFWAFIKQAKATYRDRRELIWTAFRPLVDYLEAQDRAPGVAPITEILEKFNPESVHQSWQKALDRRVEDPEGAITLARTLLETVCKHILEDEGATYPDDADLPKLWALASEKLNLAPQQHQESVFKAILGNCQSVVNNLGAIRNRIGDAHGQGRRHVKPRPRHAELAVNLAGAMAAFLVATWHERSN
jgi:hypothetical protein